MFPAGAGYLHNSLEKTGLAGSLYLNWGLHIDHRLPQICSDTPLGLFQLLPDPGTSLVAVSQGCPIWFWEAVRGREKQALDSAVSVEVV
jgi:hypothetical protein